MTSSLDDLQLLLSSLTAEELLEVVEDLPDGMVEAALRSVPVGEQVSWETPGELAQELLPETVQTPALNLIDDALRRTYDQEGGRLIISMPPQEGKSERASHWFPEWVLTRNPDARIAVVSYEATTAARWSQRVRDDIFTYGGDLGLAVRRDVSGKREWQLEGVDSADALGGMYATGIGGPLTGRRVDLLIIDDPISNMEQANSKLFRDRAWHWWQTVGSTRLAPGASVVLILTRWHHDDLAGRLLEAEDGDRWEVINIPAQADHRPEDGEVDLLGREPGEFLESTRGRSAEEWEQIKVQVGPRSWSALYQGRPSPEEGGLFPGTWARYSEQLWVEREDGSRWVPEGDGDTELVQSWDMAFKDETSSDYVVGQVWLRQGARVFLLDQIRARLSFRGSVEAVLTLTARWPQAAAKFIEDKANGPAIINMLSRTVPGMIPVEPEGSKYARASAISPFAHSGSIVLPSAQVLPNVEELVEEARVFPTGSHDDTVDALSQAVNRLLLNPLTPLGEDVVTTDDLYGAGMGYLGGY